MPFWKKVPDDRIVIKETIRALDSKDFEGMRALLGQLEDRLHRKIRESEASLNTKFFNPQLEVVQYMTRQLSEKGFLDSEAKHYVTRSLDAMLANERTSSNSEMKSKEIRELFDKVKIFTTDQRNSSPLNDDTLPDGDLGIELNTR